MMELEDWEKKEWEEEEKKCNEERADLWRDELYEKLNKRSERRWRGGIMEKDGPLILNQRTRCPKGTQNERFKDSHKPRNKRSGHRGKRDNTITKGDCLEEPLIKHERKRRPPKGTPKRLSHK